MRTTFEMHAVSISKNIPIGTASILPYRLLSKTRHQAVLEVGKKSYLFLYSFGSVVLFNVADADRKRILELIPRNGEVLGTDDYSVIVQPKKPEVIDFNEVRLKSIAMSKLKVIAEVLAQSVGLDTMEDSVDQKLQVIGKINRRLKKGSFNVSDKRILKMIGENNDVIQHTLTKLCLLDEPEVTWEDQRLSNLFYQMRKMFELDDRFETLQLKTDYIQKNMVLLVDLRQSRREQLLELTIVLLIAFEIMLFIYDLWF